MFRFGMSRWRISAVSGAVVAAMAAAALPAAAVQPVRQQPTVPARYADQRLGWEPCDPGSALECAAMTVPATGTTRAPARTSPWKCPGTAPRTRHGGAGC